MNENASDFELTPCHICGSDKFTKGSIKAFGGMQFKKDFQPPKPEWGVAHARRCDQCGNLQFFVRPPNA